MLTVALLIVRPPAAGIAYQPSNELIVWPLCVEVFVLGVSTVSDELGEMPVMRVPVGKLPFTIVIPTVNPVVSAMAMVFAAALIVAEPRLTLAREFRLSVPPLTKVPPV